MASPSQLEARLAACERLLKHLAQLVAQFQRQVMAQQQQITELRGQQRG